MQLAKFENGIENHGAKISQSIYEAGLFVQHEGAYSYTVGMNEHNLPEMVIKNDQGLKQSEIYEIFQALRRCSKRTELKKELISLGLKCTALSELDKRRCFYSARIHYGNWDFYSAGLKRGEE